MPLTNKKRKAYQRAYYKEKASNEPQCSTDARREAQRDFYEKNSLSTRRKQYALKCEEKKEAMRVSFVANPEAKKQKERDSYKANPEAKMQKKRDSYKANPKTKKAKERDSYKANPEAKKRKGKG